MKKVKYVGISFFFCLLFSVYVFSQPMAEEIYTDDCTVVNKTFSGGESLVYKLYYNWKFVWIPAGEVTFVVEESADHYDVKINGRTYESYDNFFKVRDYYYSKIEKETLFPTNFVRKVEEGKYRLFDSIVFDQSQSIAKTFHGKTEETAQEGEMELGECMQDMVSLIYYMRNLQVDNLNRGENIPIKMFFDKEVFPLEVTYNGKDKKKKVKGLGKFKTIKITPELVAGNVFKEGDRMQIWVSDDDNKLPLLIESPVSIGSVKAVLKSYDGLKYPLSSKL